MRRSFGNIILALLSGALLLAGLGCTTFDGKIDLNVINTELKALHADLGDMLILVEGDEKLEPAISNIHEIVEIAQGALQGYLDGHDPNIDSVYIGIDTALDLADGFLEEISPDDERTKRIRLGIFAAKIVLRRVKLYLPEGS